MVELKSLGRVIRGVISASKYCDSRHSDQTSDQFFLPNKRPSLCKIFCLHTTVYSIFSSYHRSINRPTPVPSFSPVFNCPGQTSLNLNRSAAIGRRGVCYAIRLVLNNILGLKLFPFSPFLFLATPVFFPVLTGQKDRQPELRNPDTISHQHIWQLGLERRMCGSTVRLHRGYLKRY